MARRVIRTRGSGRRKLVWARQANLGAAIPVGPGGTFGADLLTPFRTQLEARTPGITVMRIRLQWRIAETNGQSRGVVMAIRGYTESVGSPGQTATDLAGPVEDPHADWMAYDSHLLSPETTASFAHEQRDVDVKSMRKLDEVSDSLAIVFQTADELAAQVRYVASVLVALP